jgi:hypothetical protein
MDGGFPMRLAFALALLLLPATAFAQGGPTGPTAPIPVHKCVQTTSGDACGPVRNGDKLSAADGYTRADRPSAADRSQAMAAQPQPAEPNVSR